MGKTSSGRHRGIAPAVAACLLGTSVLSGSSVAAATPSVASCPGNHTNVVPGDKAILHASYGQKGEIVTNTTTTLQSLHDAFYRSFYLGDGSFDFVEVGFGSHVDAFGTHWWTYWFADLNGKYFGPNWDRSLSPSTAYNFIIENVGDRGIFRFLFEGNLFGYSPTMDFNTGPALANSEKYNSCDTAYTHMYNLEDTRTDGPNWYPWQNMECWINNTTDWYVHENNNGDFDVSQNYSSVCPPGTYGGW